MNEVNKSGYQLRAEILSMARGIVDDRVNRLEHNQHFLAENDAQYKRKTVAPYTTEEVIVEAEKLYAFVQKRQK